MFAGAFVSERFKVPRFRANRVAICGNRCSDAMQRFVLVRATAGPLLACKSRLSMRFLHRADALNSKPSGAPEGL
jgi:hypothetical protein